jgi:hypothetical protein
MLTQHYRESWGHVREVLKWRLKGVIISIFFIANEVVGVAITASWRKMREKVCV